ncbi:hypothetical protein FHS43_006606 [Streptosporangium becharense]|uniref:Uncharacterized protein n=1 Tax=Streptosporangium becharense TaxID=1816182 RepID=A0A7W9ME27_9ACTN|nr:hypothetical protein [Streptosporangium becharense]MBB2915286.1 hypothetical protein [Streptosporangium becharense]MBB5817016.1 hypothetical protein [Streptosporangium becharense]
MPKTTPTTQAWARPVTNGADPAGKAVVERRAGLPVGHPAGQRLHRDLVRVLDPAVMAQSEDGLGVLTGFGGGLPPDAVISQQDDRRDRSSVARTGEERGPGAHHVSPPQLKDCFPRVEQSNAAWGRQSPERA